MERYVRFVVRYRRAVVVAVLVVTAMLATQLRYVHLEIRRRAQLPQAHPYVQVQNRIADLFGGETTVIIGVVARQGDIFTADILGKIVRITRRLEDTPGVIRSSVFSIAAEHVKLIRGTPEGMEVRPLLADVPDDPQALADLKASVLGDDLYAGTLVARDGKAAAIVVEFDDELTDAEIRNTVDAAIKPELDPTVEIPVGGAPVVRAFMADYTRTMAILFPIAVLIIGLVHYEAFRTLQAMLLPLVTALLSVLWALGVMGVLRQPIDTWSAMTPVVILAVAAGHAVQILKRYYEEYSRGGDNHDAVIRSVTAIGPVMLTAGFIASAGFASLVLFGVASVRAFGLLLALGIVSALIIEMTFTPACRAMLPPPRARELARERESPILRAVLEWIARITVQHPQPVLLVATLITVVFLMGVPSVRVDNSFKAWFPENSPLRRADALLNERLAGTSTVNLLIEADAEGGIEDPNVLRAISDLETFLKGRPDIGAAVSIADYVKHMHRAMNGDDPSFQVIPPNRELVAQYLLLYSFSGPNDFASIVDPTHRFSVIRAYAKTDGAQFGHDLFADLNAFVVGRFAGTPAKVYLGGGSLGVQTALNEVIVWEKILNVLQVTVIIFVLSALLLRSVVAGLIVLTPLCVAVVVNLGIMGWSGTPLSIATAAITAMAVSIGADFAIYLVFRIREELVGGAGLTQALRESLLTSGKAIFFVSSAVAVGYLVLPFSGFGAWTYLGILTALMVGVSALATLTIIPSVAMKFRLRIFADRTVDRAAPPSRRAVI